CIFKLNNNSTDPNGLNDIKNSVWTIKEKSTGNVKDTSSCLAGVPLCGWTLLSTLPAGAYIAQLYVEDLSLASGVATKEFIVRQDIIADFSCSLDNVNWKKCDDSNFRPIKGGKVYFKDVSQKSDGSLSIASRVWKKDGAVFSLGNDFNPSSNIQGTVIELTAEDDVGRSGSQQYTITTRLPLPEWQETSPF
ncbi:MAG: hypothetical protein Q7K28_03405, partial [Candidatus Wildermuthbacteria bacterium]|nr:hypothetical protein [Candidatus Wildermuthbacteria bacterium]